MLGMFVLSSLSALWLAVGISFRLLAFQRALHPVIWLLLAWAGWQCVSLLGAENTHRAWFGIVQTGEGAAWNIMLCLLFFMIMPLWQQARCQRIMLLVALASLAVMSWLHFFPARFCNTDLHNDITDNPNAPANWPDYLAFIAGWLWIAYASVPRLRTACRHAWAVIILSIILVVSENHSAHFIMYTIMIGSGIMLWLQATRRLPDIFVPKKTWRILAMVGCVLPFFWALSADKDSLFPDKNCVSLQQRNGFNQASFTMVKQEPCILAAGKGWGRFDDDFFKNALFQHTYMFKDGEYNMNWIGLTTHVFHPHNQPLAVLLALGIPGLLLFLAMPMAIIWRIRREAFWWCVPMVLAVNTLGYVWFLMPQVLAFQALGMVALAAACRTGISSHVAVPRWAALPVLVMAPLLAWSAAEAYGSRFEHIIAEDPNQPGMVDWLAQDIARGGERLVEGALFHAETMVMKIRDHTLTDKERDWFRNFLDVAHRAAASEKATPRMAMLETKLVMGLFRIAIPSPLDELKPALKAGMPDMIVRFSAIVPAREDFTVPFFLSLDDYAQGDKAMQVAFLERVLAVAPNHRTALWLLGGLNHDEAMKKRAAQLGVDRVFPVTKEELAPYRD